MKFRRRPEENILDADFARLMLIWEKLRVDGSGLEGYIVVVSPMCCEWEESEENI